MGIVRNAMALLGHRSMNDNYINYNTAKNGRLKQISLVNSTESYELISTMLNVKTKKGSSSNQ